MITFFAIPKAFKGHISVIQRNAIKSWTLLYPHVEVILFGDDEGTAETAKELGIRHIPDVALNEFGTPLLNFVFDTAQAAASHEIVAYVNADIILMSDFAEAVKRMPDGYFMMAGRRWDLNVSGRINFEDSAWEETLKAEAHEKGRLSTAGAIDYFVFRKGFWKDIPPFAIGRTVWDNWLLYYARLKKAPLIDITDVVTAVHQNHDYNHNPKGFDFIWKGPEAERNLKLAGEAAKFTLDNATFRLTAHGFKRPKITPDLIYRRIESLQLLMPALAPLSRFLIMMLDPLVKIKKSISKF